MCPTDDEMILIAKDRRNGTAIMLDRLDKLEVSYTGIQSEIIVIKDSLIENTALTADIKEFLTGIRNTRHVTRKVAKFCYNTVTAIGAISLAIAAIWVLITAIETGQAPGSLTPPIATAHPNIH